MAAGKAGGQLSLFLTLSKQNTFSLPQKLILGGLIQNICFFFNRLWAYTVPTVMAAGKAGGTIIVMMSRTRITIRLTSACIRRGIKNLNSNQLFSFVISILNNLFFLHIEDLTQVVTSYALLNEPMSLSNNF